jgi:N-acetylneuraminic acid mutarotase
MIKMKPLQTTRNMKTNFVAIVATLMLCGLLSTVSISVAEAGKWKKKAGNQIPRWGLTSSVVDGKIYIFGGMMGNNCCPRAGLVESYDPSTDTWDSPTVMPTARNALASGVVDGVIYVIGGAANAGGFNLVEAYNPATNTWEQKKAMPTGRGFHTAAVVNDVIYVFGGQSGENNPSGIAIVEAYNPATDTWEKKADMPTPRLTFSTSVVEGKIYAIGGRSKNAGDAEVFATVEIYNPATNTWTRGADMPTARGGLSTSVVDGKIYAISGSNANLTAVRSVEIYDPKSDTWTSAEEIPTARQLSTARAINRIIYVIDGGAAINTNFPEGIVEAFDTGSGGVSSAVTPAGKLSTIWSEIKAAR